MSNNTGILIRLDDIAENMNWDLMEQSEALFDNYKIKPVLGVIPNNQDKDLLSYPKKSDFWKIVKNWKSKGWEIAMHGLTHVYDKETNKNDFFRYGGKSEFYGHSLEVQTERIKKGLKIFNEKEIEIKSFFAPNHTYDLNTFDALKNCGIEEVIDGYGLIPYEEKNIKFIPQLFYKIYALPFGIQSTQIHLNYWNQKDFDKFKIFVEKNKRFFITYEQAIGKVKNGYHNKVINNLVKFLLKTKRLFS